MPEINSSLNDCTDLQLFSLLREDNDIAFGILYRRYWSSMIRIASRKLNSRQKAEDMIQDIFVNIYNRRHTIELNTSFSGYIMQALNFSIANDMRSRQVKQKYQQSVFFGTHGKNDFASHFDYSFLRKRINYSLESLPGKCRKAFILSREEKLPYKSISQTLNISVSTVEKHIGKALKVMRHNLREFNYN